MIKIAFFFGLMALIILSACMQQEDKKEQFSENWHNEFEKQLSLSGHRNWVLVVDKAFPEQPGMIVINTNEHLLAVLKEVLSHIESSTHVKPVIYTDAELQYINDSLAAGATEFKKKLQLLLNGLPAQSILHDSVFVKMNEAQKLFSVTVLKTEEVIPYSSVFIQLDCKYWNGDKENKLRAIMKQDKK